MQSKANAAMWIRLVLTASIVTLSFSQSSASRRVFLISFDGLGYQRLTADPVAQELTTLQALFKTGAHADGLTPAFPSTTANGHAALWTGTYAGRNGILYNSNPVSPRSEHLFTERIVGFRSEGLTAEPIWLAAARQHVTVVAHQVTQAYPFLPTSVGTQPTNDLLVINGYQSRSFGRWRAVRSSDRDVQKVECAAAAARACYEWTIGKEAGPLRFQAAVLADRIRLSVSSGGPSVDATLQPAETEPPRRRALARHWSRPLAIDGLPDSVPASVIFRLFELNSTTGDFVLMQSPVQESAMYGAGIDPRRFVAEAGPMIGNGASGVYWGGGFGTPAYDGGSGEAERRYLETIELAIRQQIAQSTWLARQRQPRLLISYLSSGDETDHAWYGLDRAGDRRYTEFRRWAYVAIEHAARAFVGLASADDHVIVTSDHGMSPARTSFGANAALAQAGLEQLASTVNTCILLNTTDWKGGTIDASARDSVIERVRRALLDVRSPAGDPVVTKVYSSREEMAVFGHDGPGGADMCFDVAPGIGVSESSKVLSEVNPPTGGHGLDPTRADMKAILLIRGPRAPRGKDLGPLRSASVAALVADLLGIEPPRQSTFPSPLK